MKDLKKYCKSWIDQNICDGEDRREAHSDVIRMSSPELYEMVDDMLEMYLDEYMSIPKSEDLIPLSDFDAKELTNIIKDATTDYFTRLSKER